MATPMEMEDAIRGSEPNANLLHKLLQDHTKLREQPTSDALFLQLFKVTLTTGAQCCLDVLLKDYAAQHHRYTETDRTHLPTTFPPEPNLVLLNLRTRSGETVAHLACQVNSPLVAEILKFLCIESICDELNGSQGLRLVDLTDSQGHTLLHTCLSAGSEASLNALKEYFSSLNQNLEPFVYGCEESRLRWSPTQSSNSKDEPPKSPMELAASMIFLEYSREENFRRTLQSYLQLFLSHCSKAKHLTLTDSSTEPIEEKILYTWLTRTAENIGNRNGLVLQVFLTVLDSLVPVSLRKVLSGMFVPAGEPEGSPTQRNVIFSKQTILHEGTHAW